MGHPPPSSLWLFLLLSVLTASESDASRALHLKALSRSVKENDEFSFSCRYNGSASNVTLLWFIVDPVTKLEPLYFNIPGARQPFPGPRMLFNVTMRPDLWHMDVTCQAQLPAGWVERTTFRIPKVEHTLPITSVIFHRDFVLGTPLVLICDVRSATPLKPKAVCFTEGKTPRCTKEMKLLGDGTQRFIYRGHGHVTMRMDKVPAVCIALWQNILSPTGNAVSRIAAMRVHFASFAEQRWANRAVNRNTLVKLSFNISANPPPLKAQLKVTVRSEEGNRSVDSAITIRKGSNFTFAVTMEFPAEISGSYRVDFDSMVKAASPDFFVTVVRAEILWLRNLTQVKCRPGDAVDINFQIKSVQPPSGEYLRLFRLSSGERRPFKIVRVARTKVYAVGNFTYDVYMTLFPNRTGTYFVEFFSEKTPALMAQFDILVVEVPFGKTVLILFLFFLVLVAVVLLLVLCALPSYFLRRISLLSADDYEMSSPPSTSLVSMPA